MEPLECTALPKARHCRGLTTLRQCRVDRLGAALAAASSVASSGSGHAGVGDSGGVRDHGGCDTGDSWWLQNLDRRGAGEVCVVHAAIDEEDSGKEEED